MAEMYEVVEEKKRIVVIDYKHNGKKFGYSKEKLKDQNYLCNYLPIGHGRAIMSWLAKQMF